MTARGFDWYKLIFLLPLVILLPLCEKQEASRLSKQAAQSDSALSNVQELMLTNPSEIEQNINRIMKLIKEKEAELKKAQQEIDLRSAELKQREEQLAKIEIRMKKFRNSSYFILAIGSMLIMVGLWLLLARRKLETY